MLVTMSQEHLRSQEIVANILELAENRGLSRVTTAALARRLGFTEAALYRYFPGKDAILAAALNHLAEALLATMAAELDPPLCTETRPSTAQLADHINRFTARQGLLVELLLAAVVNGGQELHEAANAFLQDYTHRMRVYFGQLQELGLTRPEVVPEELATMWTCQILGGFVRCRLTREHWEPSRLDSFRSFVARLATRPR